MAAHGCHKLKFCHISLVSSAPKKDKKLRTKSNGSADDKGCKYLKLPTRLSNEKPYKQ
jgi:hypothetical protein